MKALIDAMVATNAQAAAATAAAQAAGVATGAASPPAAFALYQGDSNAGVFLDFATTDAKKTFRSAITPINTITTSTKANCGYS
jgi:hypothetical protein